MAMFGKAEEMMRYSGVSNEQDLKKPHIDQFSRVSAILKEGASKVKVGICGQASLKRSPSFLMRPRLKWLKPCSSFITVVYES
jgi:hypothetical protein